MTVCPATATASTASPYGGTDAVGRSHFDRVPDAVGRSGTQSVNQRREQPNGPPNTSRKATR